MTSSARWAADSLQYSFDNPDLLRRALTHRSASSDNNERLEFLGDAFLSFSVARRLYERRPNDSEGDLSRLRAALVRRATLAVIGSELGIEAHVILGSGELRSGGGRRNSILANTVEALIGAVLLDGGRDAADALIGRLFEQRLARLPEAASLKDPKTRLQEWLQGQGLNLPSYAVVSVSGQAHDQTFTVSCQIEERGAETSGKGSSRRRAEQQAATAMLARLERE